MSNEQIVFSGYIEKNAGFNSPSLFQGPPGWTVFKAAQDEIFKVTHNLALTSPKMQLHVVVQTMKQNVISEVSLSKNDFTISTWLAGPAAAVDTSLMFIACYYPYRRHIAVKT